MKKFKIKAIQADEGILTHILVHSDIFEHKQAQLSSEPSVTLVYTEPKAYSEP